MNTQSFNRHSKVTGTFLLLMAPLAACNSTNVSVTAVQPSANVIQPQANSTSALTQGKGQSSGAGLPPTIFFERAEVGSDAQIQLEGLGYLSAGSRSKHAYSLDYTNSFDLSDQSTLCPTKDGVIYAKPNANGSTTLVKFSTDTLDLKTIATTSSQAAQFSCTADGQSLAWIDSQGQAHLQRGESPTTINLNQLDTWPTQVEFLKNAAELKITTLAGNSYLLDLSNPEGPPFASEESPSSSLPPGSSEPADSGDERIAYRTESASGQPELWVENDQLGTRDKVTDLSSGDAVKKNHVCPTWVQGELFYANETSPGSGQYAIFKAHFDNGSWQSDIFAQAESGQESYLCPKSLASGVKP